MRGRASSHQHWFRSANDIAFGIVAWYGGDFTSSRSLLEEATAALAAGGIPNLDTAWFVPNEPIVSSSLRTWRSRGASKAISKGPTRVADAVRRAALLDFPQGPFSRAFFRRYEIWVRIEAGQLDRAATVAEELTSEAPTARLRLLGRNRAPLQQATVGALSALSAGEMDPKELQTHIGTLTFIVQSWREAEATLFVSFYDAVLAQLLTAAGKPDEARERLDIALQLGDAASVNFYRAELLRAASPHRRRHRQTRCRPAGSHRYRLQKDHLDIRIRAVIDDFELRGASCRDALADAISRFPADSDWPELIRARTLLRVSRAGRQGRHPRWWHGRAECRLATERTGLAGSLQLHHRLPTRLAAQQEGRIQPRPTRTHQKPPGCIFGSDTTRTRSGYSASATPKSTAPQPIPPRRSKPGIER